MFFKEIFERIGDYTLTLTIAKDNGQLVVMLVPKLEAKKNDALKEIIPLTVKGTPEQLDAGFILAISQGISMTTGLQTNIKEFEAGLEKAKKKLKGKDDKDDKKDDVKTDSEDEKDEEKDDDEKDENNNLPFDGGTVNEETGEVKETKIEPAPVTTKKSAEPKVKSAEPKVKEPKAPKEEKKPDVPGTALSGEPPKTDDDEW